MTGPYKYTFCNAKPILSELLNDTVQISILYGFQQRIIWQGARELLITFQ